MFLFKCSSDPRDLHVLPHSFPPLRSSDLPDANTRATMVDAHFRALGAGLFEAAVAWFAPDWRLRRRGEIVGLEHLDAAQSDGSGVLLLTGHFTTLEVGARYVAMEIGRAHV